MIVSKLDASRKLSDTRTSRDRRGAGEYLSVAKFSRSSNAGQTHQVSSDLKMQPLLSRFAQALLAALCWRNEEC